MTIYCVWLEITTGSDGEQKNHASEKKVATSSCYQSKARVVTTAHANAWMMLGMVE